MRRAAAFVVLALAAIIAGAQAAVDGQTKIASSVPIPVDLAFRGSEGTLYDAELNTGNVRSLASVGASPALVAHVPASPGGNGGFTGLAPDPNDAHTFFVVYSHDNASAPH